MRAQDEASAIYKIISDWKESKIYKTAVLADTVALRGSCLGN